MRSGYVAIYVAALIASLLCAPASAQWKWRDKNNQVQYSDLPPPQGVPDSSILQRPPTANRRAPPASAALAASAAALPATKGVEPELEAKLRKAEQDKAAKDKAEAEKAKAEAEKVALQKADNCARARLQLRALEQGIRVASVNEKGERVILDDKGRSEEVARTREAISNDCK